MTGPGRPGHNSLRTGPHGQWVDPEAVRQETEEVGFAWADAKAAARVLERTLEVKKGEAFQRAKNRGASDSTAKVVATTSDDVVRYGELVDEALHASDRAYVRWLALQEYNGMRRTRETTEREIMKKVGI